MRKLFKIKCVICGKEVLGKQPYRMYCGSRNDKTSCTYKKQLSNGLASYHKSKKEGRYVSSYNFLLDRRNKLKKNFGMTLEDYDKMFKKQKGLCAICDKPQNTFNTKNLYIDHDHKTGKVRGLLCHKCNNGLGFLDDDIKLLKRSIQYLERSRSIII